MHTTLFLKYFLLLLFISPSFCDDESYSEELVFTPLKHHFLASQFNFVTRIPQKDSSMRFLHFCTLPPNYFPFLSMHKIYESGVSLEVSGTFIPVYAN